MMIVASALKKRQSEGRPVRARRVGAGVMRRGVAKRNMGAVPGIERVAISTLATSSRSRAPEPSTLAVRNVRHTIAYRE